MVWIAAAAAGGVVIAAALMLGLWRLGVRSQSPRWLPNVVTPDVPYEPVQFLSKGSKLQGWLMRPPSSGDLPAVVVAHGWGSNRSRVLRYAQPLYDAGFAVFLFDARSHGDSEAIAAPSGFMFRDDVAAAVEKVRSIPGIDPERVAVLGHSLGGFGALAAFAAGRLPVKAIVTDSTPLRLETMLRSELKRRRLPLFPLAWIIPRIWFYRSGITASDVKQADIPAWLAVNHQGGKLPVLMIHSTGDAFIPAEDLVRLVQQHPLRHLFVRSEGHSSSEQDPAFWGEVLPFLKERLFAE